MVSSTPLKIISEIAVSNKAVSSTATHASSDEIEDSARGGRNGGEVLDEVARVGGELLGNLLYGGAYSPLRYRPTASKARDS